MTAELMVVARESRRPQEALVDVLSRDVEGDVASESEVAVSVRVRVKNGRVAVAVKVAHGSDVPVTLSKVTSGDGDG